MYCVGESGAPEGVALAELADIARRLGELEQVHSRTLGAFTQQLPEQVSHARAACAAQEREGGQWAVVRSPCSVPSSTSHLATLLPGFALAGP